MNVKRKFRIFSARLEVAKKDLEITKEVFSEAKSEFSADFMKRIIVTDEEPSSNKENEDQNSQVSKERRESRKRISEDQIEEETPTSKDEDLKKVFKQIARKTHPDLLYNKTKFEREKKEELFKKAKKAIEEDDIYELSRIAKELDIEPPNPTKKHVQMLQDTLQRVSKEVLKIKNSVAWLWYHEDDEEKRLKLMNKYINAIKKS